MVMISTVAETGSVQKESNEMLHRFPALLDAALPV